MTNDNWIGSGYDAEVSSGSGHYLRLKKRGDKARLRMVSDPYRYIDVLKKDGEQDKILKKVGWLAIHKFMEGGKPQKKVVVFQGGPQIYGALQDLAESDDWGDPKLYDVEIERTEEAGKYYVVRPLPKPIGPLSAEETAMVAECGIDLERACTGNVAQSTTVPAATVEEIEDIFADE